MSYVDVLKSQRQGSPGGPLLAANPTTHRAGGWTGAWVGVMADLGKGGLQASESQDHRACELHQ